jgi:hypothetical protein
MVIDRRKKKSDQTGAKDDSPGQVGFDDRGNRTWEWTEDEELQADDELGAATRLDALAGRQLQLDDDDEIPHNEALDIPTQVVAKGLKTGYNPYNSGALGKRSWKKKKDMRELSKWIEIRKRVAAKRDDD